MIFTFRADVSYDGPEQNAGGQTYNPKTYVLAGMFARHAVWEAITAAWNKVNDDYRVSRFHATQLNCKQGIYAGWDNRTKIAYSSDMLDILRLHEGFIEGVSCGMFADDYRRIINDAGRRRMGSPYLACFNSSVALIARAMDYHNYPREDQFHILIDRDNEYADARASFYAMRENPLFEHRHRLLTCNISSMDTDAALQTADLLAYESFKRLHAFHLTGDNTADLRYPLKTLLEIRNTSERFFNAKSLMGIRDFVEGTQTGDGRLVIIPET